MDTIEQIIAGFHDMEKEDTANNNPDGVEYDKTMARWLEELVKLRKDYGEVITQKEDAQKAGIKARNKAADIVKECNERLARANGILEGVKAMLQAQEATTHRQRDYYNRAIVQMIDNVKTSIKPIDEICFEPDDLPF